MDAIWRNYLSYLGLIYRSASGLFFISTYKVNELGKPKVIIHKDRPEVLLRPAGFSHHKYNRQTTYDTDPRYFYYPRLLFHFSPDLDTYEPSS